MSSAISTRVTHGTTASDIVISTAAQSMRIDSIVIANNESSSQTVTLEDSDGNVVFESTVYLKDTVDFSQSWLADNGLTVKNSTSSANVHVTVFHSAIGT